MLLEWLLIGVATALGVRTLRPRDGRGRLLLLSMVTAGAAVTIAASVLSVPPPPSPIALGAEPFATSGACRSCHPSEYSSWHASYHRRMTQQAVPAAAAAPALREGGRLRIETTGRTVELFARENALWARLPDPGVTSGVSALGYEAAFRAAPAREAQIQLLTGSHRHQAFWVTGARPGELRTVPVVYLIEEQRLVPRRDAFLNPPDSVEQSARWNSNCVQCHAVAGAPGHEPTADQFATSAAELGIACEACHGASAEHVRAMQSPLARYRARAGSPGEPRVVNPRKLDAARASQVCGRCHSYFFPKQENEWWAHGFSRSYAPGQDLSRAQLLLSPEALSTPGAPKLEASVESLFYADGTIRIGGREYNGLVRSACYERGHGDEKLSCTSCHSLHRGAPDAELDPEKLGNRACAGCHARQSAALPAHSHHRPSSPGSLCYNCHMPHTSYALLGAARSHRVDSPAFDERSRDRPNACNLCHLERSEAWAARQSAAWYGPQARFMLERGSDRAAEEAPSGAVFALSGDAAVRAITAAALERHESSADAPALRLQLLSELSRDDYAAVRAIAERARRSAAASAEAPPLSSAVVERLLARRDRRPVTLAE